MKQSVVIAELSRLVALEIDALHAYDVAIAWLGGPATPVGDELALLKVEHQRHALGLHEALHRLGGRAPDIDEPDVKGVVIGALTPPRRRPTAPEILEAMRWNEQLTRSVYRKMLATALPADVRALVEGAAEDEQRHLAWFEAAIARGVWLTAPAFSALP